VEEGSGVEEDWERAGVGNGGAEKEVEKQSKEQGNKKNKGKKSSTSKTEGQENSKGITPEKNFPTKEEKRQRKSTRGREIFMGTVTDDKIDDFEVVPVEEKIEKKKKTKRKKYAWERDFYGDGD